MLAGENDIEFMESTRNDRNINFNNLYVKYKIYNSAFNLELLKKRISAIIK
jgi:hypothetical protein